MARYPKCQSIKIPVQYSEHKTPIVERFHLLLAINRVEELSVDHFKRLKWFTIDGRKVYLGFDVEGILEQRLKSDKEKKLDRFKNKFKK